MCNDVEETIRKDINVRGYGMRSCVCGHGKLQICADMGRYSGITISEGADAWGHVNIQIGHRRM